MKILFAAPISLLFPVVNSLAFVGNYFRRMTNLDLNQTNQLVYQRKGRVVTANPQDAAILPHNFKRTSQDRTDRDGLCIPLNVNVLFYEGPDFF